MTRAVATLALAATILAAAPSRGRACGYVIGLVPAEPADGATDVPTDVVPWLHGRLGGTVPGIGMPEPDAGPTSEVWIALLDGTGTMVDIDVVKLAHTGPMHDSVEVRSRAPLSPRATYTLRVQTGTEVTDRTFTTGDGPTDQRPPPLADLAMQVADNAYMSSCEDNTFACVEYARETTVHATVRHAGTITAEHLWLWPSTFRYYQPQPSTDAPFCIELRARNLAGQLGPPAEICSTDVSTFAIATTSPVLCDGARITVDGVHVDDSTPVPDLLDGGPSPATPPPASDGGCAATGRAATDARAALVPALLLVVLVARRRS